MPHPPANARGTLYLIHLSRPLSHRTRKGAKQHYLGWTMDLHRRLWWHRRHPERTLVLREAQRNGIQWAVIRTWPDQTRHDERRRKNGSHMKRDCPVCKMEARLNTFLGPESDISPFLPFANYGTAQA